MDQIIKKEEIKVGDSQLKEVVLYKKGSKFQVYSMNRCHDSEKNTDRIERSKCKTFSDKITAESYFEKLLQESIKNARLVDEAAERIARLFIMQAEWQKKNKKLTDWDKSQIGELLQRLLKVLNSAYGCFLIWKCMLASTSIPEVGKQEAERRTGIMNQYDGIFTAVFYAMENMFIADLYKLFDKSKSSLKLDMLIKILPQNDREEIAPLICSIEPAIKRLETLRHNVTAHEPLKPQTEKIHTQEIESIFSVAQRIMNIAGKHTKNKYLWGGWEEETNLSLLNILDDLERSKKPG